MKNILLIDDDEKLCQLLTDYFAKFNLKLDVATHPVAGLSLLEKKNHDLLILDVMLPEMDGFEVCRQVRNQPQRYKATPIIMLTARGDVTDRIVGLELGADDYLPKPFEPRELVARINNILRRTKENQPNEDNHEISSNGLTLCTTTRSVLLDDQALDLTTMEFELLKIFMQSPGKTFSRDELMNTLRGIDAELFSRSIDTLVSRLRHKLCDNDKKARFIKTVWGRGYSFIGTLS